MQSFLDWFKSTQQDQNKPWLVLGKGPSFSKRDLFDLTEFEILSLNHAVREQPVSVAHMIDFDVVEACGESIIQNARVLVMPWFPHFRNRPGTESLESLVRRNSALAELNNQGRLLWYNHSLAAQAHGDSPVIPVRFFSSEAVLNLLARAGIRKVRSLGIDGGASYSPQFKDLTGSTLLSNGRGNFDLQFQEIAKILLRTRLDYAPLDIDSPIAIFVAATEAQMLAVKILEHSIRKHASMTVRVEPLHLSGVEIPVPKEPKNHPRTPFSFQRFLIPALNGYRGKAVYLDSDMQVFQDMRKLWMLPFRAADLLAAREPGASGRRPQFSVMLLDCGALHWDIANIVRSLNDGEFSYEDLMYNMSVATQIRPDIDPVWNSLERYVEGETALLHYTDMQTQPWVSRANPLGYLWVKELFEGLDDGSISLQFVKEHIEKGYVRPSLLFQVEHRIEDPLLLPREACALDRNFVAPFNQFLPGLKPTRDRLLPWLKALARHHYSGSIMQRLERRMKDSVVRWRS
jgi:hypothetical protein